MKEAHVFVCHGALSFDAANRIARHVLAAGASCYFLITFAADLTKVPTGVVALAMSPPADAHSEWVKPFATASWFSSALARLRLDGIGSIVAYFPHPFELPGNHLAYSDERVVRRELLPDGLANFLSGSLAPEGLPKKLRLEVRILLRRLAARWHGLSYVPLRSGHLTQFDRLNYTATWVEPGLAYLTVRGEERLLPPRARAARAAVAVRSDGRPVVLLLNQELRGFVNSRLEQEMRASLVGLLSALGPACVYYKSHPRGDNRAGSLAAAGVHVVDVSSGELAEDLVVDHGISHLAGFYSTPLLTCGALVEARIAVLPNPDRAGVLKPAFARDLRQTLSAAGAAVHVVG